MHDIDFSQDENRRLGTILQLHADAIGDQPFLLLDQKRYTFAQCNERVNAYVAGLQRMGVTHGDRIIIYMHSCVEFVLLALAAAKLGAVWVPVNTDYRGQWLLQTINDSRGKMLLTDMQLLPRLLEMEEQLDHGALVVRGLSPGETDALDLADLAEPGACEPNMSHIHFGDTHAIVWTSGTTGKSKGVMQNHNVWVHASIHNNRNYEMREGDVAYNCLPLYNSAAWVANIYRALVAGIPCAIDAQFSVTDFWDRLRHYGATQTMTLGAMHMFLWNQPVLADDADNPLRMANMVPMPESLLGPFCERFGIEGNLQGFGQSEVMLLITRKDTPEKRWKNNALGGLCDGLELRMLDEGQHEVGAGEVGEFCVRPTRSHQIFNGYFDNPEADAAAWTDGWYHTGDLGMRDADGDYFFVDRKKDVIRFKGRNVSSVQIESIALQHPAVNGAAVYAVKSDDLDTEDEIKLDVILHPDTHVGAADLARHINDNAPYFCVPRYVEIVQALPYTPTNKVQKYKLREQPLAPGVWDRTKTTFKLER
jgi:crotonobetaine/carnitine-CoA ligase